MASIHDYRTGDAITQGLPGSGRCDQALRAARSIAASHGEPVVLVDEDDEDGGGIVEPDGTYRAARTPDEIAYFAGEE